MIAHRTYGPKQRQGDGASLDMTPMIDVVFQLLIFFLFAVQQRDVLAALAVVRPQAAPGGSEVELAVQVCRPISGGEDVYRLKGRFVSFDQLSANLERIAAHDPRAAVRVECEAESSHAALVRLLDACAKSKLNDIAVFSGKGEARRGQE
jgi:biopolymer transport protein ExbD